MADGQLTVGRQLADSIFGNCSSLLPVILQCEKDGEKEKKHKCFANAHAPQTGTGRLTRFDLEFKLISLDPQVFKFARIDY